MWYALALLLALHGLIHVMGFAKAFGVESLPLTAVIGKPLGIAWLGAALLMLSGAALVLARSPSWWAPVVPGLLLSQALILSAFSDAKFGTFANVVIGVAVLLSIVRGHQPPTRSARGDEQSGTLAIDEPSAQCRHGFAAPEQANS